MKNFREQITRFSNHRMFRRQIWTASILQIILWWEIRRILFNLVVGFAGLVSMAMIIGTVVLISIIRPGLMEMPDLMPFSPLLEIVAYAILANGAYTLGWFSEFLARAVFPGKTEHFAQVSLFLGLFLSCVLTIGLGFLISARMVVICVFGGGNW